jgi:Tfp pilus assembly protein PilV
MRPHPLAVVGRLALLLLSVTLLAAAAVATRYLLYEQSRGDSQYIHTLLDKVLP